MRIQNTWLGEASKLELLKSSIKVIEEDQLLFRTIKSGERLLQGIEQLAVRQFLENVNKTFLTALVI